MVILSVQMDAGFRKKSGFPEFLANVKEGDLKAEYLLPTIVDQCIRSDKAKVRLLETQDKVVWREL